MDDSLEQRSITLEQAIDALDRMGFLHKIKPGQSKSFFQYGVDVKNEGDDTIRVAVFGG